MYIRLNTRGTNQYRAKGRLEEYIICPHCGAFNDEYEERKIINGFIDPKRERITTCHKCKKSL